MNIYDRYQRVCEEANRARTRIAALEAALDAWLDWDRTDESDTSDAILERARALTDAALAGAAAVPDGANFGPGDRCAETSHYGQCEFSSGHRAPHRAGRWKWSGDGPWDDAWEDA